RVSHPELRPLECTDLTRSRAERRPAKRRAAIRLDEGRSGEHLGEGRVDETPGVDGDSPADHDDVRIEDVRQRDQRMSHRPGPAHDHGPGPGIARGSQGEYAFGRDAGLAFDAGSAADGFQAPSLTAVAFRSVRRHDDVAQLAGQASAADIQSTIKD